VTGRELAVVRGWADTRATLASWNRAPLGVVRVWLAVSVAVAAALHALVELTALFLPLAAWMVAARAGAWHELLAATFATTAIALPALVLAAVVEVGVTPRIIHALHFV
jgi:hypothetical protein